MLDPKAIHILHDTLPLEHGKRPEKTGWVEEGTARLALGPCFFQAHRIRAQGLGFIRPCARHHRLAAERDTRAWQISARLVFCAAANAARSRLARFHLRAGLGVFLHRD
jgi:hypothetical protein